MARSSINMIRVLRETAKRMKAGAPYQWGHMGSCNCGNLAQTVTEYSKGDIHRAAMARYGDWSEQLRDYCPQSGLPLDQVIDRMLETGFTREELAHLERLSDPRILKKLPAATPALKHNVRDDVVIYLQTWAALLEAELLGNLSLKDIHRKALQSTAATLDA